MQYAFAIVAKRQECVEYESMRGMVGLGKKLISVFVLSFFLSFSACGAEVSTDSVAGDGFVRCFSYFILKLRAPSDSIVKKKNYQRATANLVLAKRYYSEEKIKEMSINIQDEIAKDISSLSGGELFGYQDDFMVFCAGHSAKYGMPEN